MKKAIVIGSVTLVFLLITASSIPAVEVHAIVIEHPSQLFQKLQDADKEKISEMLNERSTTSSTELSKVLILLIILYVLNYGIRRLIGYLTGNQPPGKPSTPSPS